MRAEALSRKEGHVGADAFDRTGDPATGSSSGKLKVWQANAICRWAVERTFAWLGRCRRLAKDWENLNRKALASDS